MQNIHKILIHILYRNPSLMRVVTKALLIIHDLFHHYLIIPPVVLLFHALISVTQEDA